MCTSCKNNSINRQQITKGKLCILHIYSFYVFYILTQNTFCRTAQKEKIQKEEEAKKERTQQFPSAVTTTAATHALPTPTLPSPVTPTQATPLCSPQVTPQSTESTPQPVGIFAVQPSSFESPRTSKRRGYAASTSPASTVDSLDSLIDPGRDRTPVIHKRGRPRKVPQPPSYDDRPVNASSEEIKKWQKRKNSEKWQYEKLTSVEASDYREKEKERVSRYVSAQRQQIIDASKGQSSVYKHVEAEITPKSKAKEQSRRR